MNPNTVAQAEGYIRRYLELEIEEKVNPSAHSALEWFEIIETGLSDYRKSIRDLENKLSEARLVLR